MVIYYAAAAILAAVSFLVFLALSEGKTINTHMMLFALLLLVTNGGYLAVSLSSTLTEALLANKVCYLGGCFIPPVVMTIVLNICRFHVPKLVNIFMVAYSIIVYSFVLTTGYSTIYYTDASIVRHGGTTVLRRTHGPMHILFYILLFGYIIVLIGIVIYTLLKRKDVSTRTVIPVLMLAIGLLSIFAVVRLINAVIEPMPAAFSFVSFMLLYLDRRVMLYDVETSISKMLGNQTTYGYVMIDNQRRYLGCNSVAMKILPKLGECIVDKPVKEKSLLEAMPCLADSSKDNGSWDFEQYERYYECRIERTVHRKKHIGYIIEIRDNTEKHNYLELMFNYADELKTEVDRKTEHIQNIQNKIILSMADMVENRDNSTGGHIKRTSYVIRILIDTIKENGFFDRSSEFYNDVIKAAPMHDLGKIAIDDSILRKPGRLTAEEFEIIKTHSEKSARLVESILRGVEEEHFVNVAVNVARYHHEKWNGEGYPEQLSGESIPFEARIMAIADVYDALVSRRCYKEPMSFEQANRVMLESMGSHFDPKLREVYELSRPKLEEYYTNAAYQDR